MSFGVKMKTKDNTKKIQTLHWKCELKGGEKTNKTQRRNGKKSTFLDENDTVVVVVVVVAVHWITFCWMQSVLFWVHRNAPVQCSVLGFLSAFSAFRCDQLDRCRYSTTELMEVWMKNDGYKWDTKQQTQQQQQQRIVRDWDVTNESQKNDNKWSGTVEEKWMRERERLVKEMKNEWKNEKLKWWNGEFERYWLNFSHLHLTHCPVPLWHFITFIHVMRM